MPEHLSHGTIDLLGLCQGDNSRSLLAMRKWKNGNRDSRKSTEAARSKASLADLHSTFRNGWPVRLALSRTAPDRDQDRRRELADATCLIWD